MTSGEPVVVDDDRLISAFGHAAFARAAPGSGALGLLEKPFVDDELMSLVEQARISRQRRRRDPGLIAR